MLERLVNNQDRTISMKINPGILSFISSFSFHDNPLAQCLSHLKQMRRVLRKSMYLVHTTEIKADRFNPVTVTS